MRLKYVVGERVRIRKDISFGLKNIPFGVTDGMAKLAGKVVEIIHAEITEHDEQLYRIKEGEYQCNWSNKLFVPVFISHDEAFNLYIAGTINEEQYKEMVKSHE